jgi:Cytochrome c oxidase subunit IV
VARVVGFAEPRGAAGGEPLGADLEPIPLGSIWPLVAAAAASMIGLGLVYGPWLLLPGVAVAAITVWGWITQLDVSR